jgi:ribosomal-protein-alanine N-acetyltransferase
VVFERLDEHSQLDDIIALEAESFTNPWSRETLEWELRNSDVTFIYVLRLDDGRLGAFCICWMLFDELHINTLAVAPGYRRRGLATSLVRYVFEEALARGVRRATLEVRASNHPAIALYEHLGFRVTATRPRYYNNPDEDALILWREGLNASS